MSHHSSKSLRHINLILTITIHVGIIIVILVAKPYPTLRPHRLQPTRLFCPWDSPGKNMWVGCHFLLQGIFPTQGSNHVSYVSCIGRHILYHCTTWEALRHSIDIPISKGRNCKEARGTKSQESPKHCQVNSIRSYGLRTTSLLNVLLSQSTGAVSLTFRNC